MKKILITGADSYIGTSLEKYLMDDSPSNYKIDTLDMRLTDWREKDFSSYDSIVHVAGIAHSDHEKISKEKEQLYYAVNRDLTIDTARKAKKDGARQFIFMSSAIVYGESAPIGKTKVIYKDTAVSPINCYGDSKVQAENGLLPLNDDIFKIVILRLPMIYGKGSRGNYPMLSRLAKRTPFFPYIKNKRSMLYIETLCEFIRLMIENEEQGFFWPQNPVYSNTSELVRMIAGMHGKKIVLLKGFSGLFKLMGYGTGLINKAFGSLCYAEEISRYKTEYRMITLEESIRRTEL